MAMRIDAGIDYLRLTSTETQDKGRMHEFYQDVAGVDIKAGQKEHGAGAFGFWGKATRHALWAQKGDWRMLQVSGGYAKRSIVLTSETSNCTRLDVQFTVRLENGKPGAWMRHIRENAMLAEKQSGHPSKITAIEVNGQVQTVYIGARSSDWFMRIYDKEAESKKEEYANCVRYELELKGRASKAIWRYMAKTGQGLMYLLAVLEQKFKLHDIYIPGEWQESQPTMPVTKQEKSVDQTMRWLEQVVAPAFARVAREDGWLKPLLAVLADTLYDDEVETLLAAIERQ